MAANLFSCNRVLGLTTSLLLGILAPQGLNSDRGHCYGGCGDKDDDGDNFHHNHEHEDVLLNVDAHDTIHEKLKLKTFLNLLSGILGCMCRWP